MFVGFSKDHSSLVPLCLNILTGKITPQFHVVFDDRFTTVASLPANNSLHDQWLQILLFDQDCFLDTDVVGDGDPSAILPNEFVEWFGATRKDHHSPLPSHSTRRHDPSVIIDDLDAIEAVTDTPLHYDSASDPPHVPEGVVGAPEGVIDTIPVDTIPDNIPSLTSDGDVSVDDGVPEGVAPLLHPSGHPCWNVGTYKDGLAANIRCLPITGEDYDFSFHTMNILDMPVAMIASRGLQHSQPLPCRICKNFLLDCNILQDQWEFDNL